VNRRVVVLVAPEFQASLVDVMAEAPAAPAGPAGLVARVEVPAAA
jgi:hypothetical protein